MLNTASSTFVGLDLCCCFEDYFIVFDATQSFTESGPRLMLSGDILSVWKHRGIHVDQSGLGENEFGLLACSVHKAPLVLATMQNVCRLLEHPVIRE